MAVQVTVDVTDAKVIFALNTTGGPVNEWRNKCLRLIKSQCIATAPVNSPLNAKHRGGVVGTFKKSFHTKAGNHGHEVTGTISNSAPHAYWAEVGRDPALNTTQRFSWTGFKPPGRIAVVKNTKGYIGSNTMKYAVNDVLEAQTDYYFPML